MFVSVNKLDLSDGTRFQLVVFGVVPLSTLLHSFLHLHNVSSNQYLLTYYAFLYKYLHPSTTRLVLSRIQD
jgi:hypothetical protein